MTIAVDLGCTARKQTNRRKDLRPWLSCGHPCKIHVFVIIVTLIYRGNEALAGYLSLHQTVEGLAIM